MDTIKSLDIIDRMLVESKKSLHRNSFFFILWGTLLIPAGISDFILFGDHRAWYAWPIMSTIGGIASAIYGWREGKRSGIQTMGDRITMYTWGAFGFTLVFAIFYSIFNHLSPYPMVLLLAGSATFISGGISNFKPFIFGAMALVLGAFACGFIIEPSHHGLVFAIALLLGYIVPGFMLKKEEHLEA